MPNIQPVPYVPRTQPIIPGGDGKFLRTELQNVSKSIRSLVPTPVKAAGLPTASAALEGTICPVTDSTTITWGATITGGGAHHVLAYCNGSAWTVAAI